MRDMHNQKGFSVVEMVLVLVVLGSIGVLGKYIVDVRQKTTQSTKAEKQDTPQKQNKVPYTIVKSDGGETIESRSKEYSILLPKKWAYHVTTGGGGNDSIVYISPNENSMAKDLNMTLYTTDNLCPPLPPTRGIQDKTFTTKPVQLNGLTGYRTEAENDADAMIPGQRFVTYTFCKDKTGFYAHYTIYPGDLDLTADLDAVIDGWKF